MIKVRFEALSAIWDVDLAAVPSRGDAVTLFADPKRYKVFDVFWTLGHAKHDVLVRLQ